MLEQIVILGSKGKDRQGYYFIYRPKKPASKRVKISGVFKLGKERRAGRAEGRGVGVGAGMERALAD